MSSFRYTIVRTPTPSLCCSKLGDRVWSRALPCRLSSKSCGSNCVSFGYTRRRHLLHTQRLGVACGVHGGGEPIGSGEFLEFSAGKEEYVEKKESNFSDNGDRFSWVRKIAGRYFSVHSEKWTVPWTAKTIAQVMLLWIAAFWFVGTYVVPLISHTAGFSKESLTHRGQALYSLLTDIAEGLAGMAILHLCLAKFQPLPPGWFKLSLRGAWYLDVVIGCLFFPLVNLLSHINIRLISGTTALPVGVSSVEQSIVARDPVAMVLYAVVVSVCAPIWEEIVFRGFLLPSLTRYMPLWSSIVVSAIAFALAHFNVQRVLPLVFLGVLMGSVFARSRNLFSSMVLHSLWNGFVFLDLMK